MQINVSKTGWCGYNFRIEMGYGPNYSPSPSRTTNTFAVIAMNIYARYSVTKNDFAKLIGLCSVTTRIRESIQYKQNITMLISSCT